MSRSAIGKRLHQARVELAAGALARDRDRSVDTAAAVVDLGDRGDLDQPDRQRQLLAAGSRRDPPAVPAREHVHEGLLDLGAEAEAPRDL